ncbi:AsmA domain-containing protein [Bordetella sputigena]|uniref:AsmA family protein n=1 Tax=Bordetella sputigena TaxID=1416810 RepID=UPI0039EE4E16
MKTWTKRISIGVAVVLALAVAAVAVFLLTFDPNAYKDRLQAWVQERYHRTLTIEGDIDATLFPSLGLTLQGVSLSEPNSSETFASMETARMSVAIWPLLSRHIVLDHASFSGVKARVVRDKQGRLNFQDLLGEPAQAQKPPADSAGKDDRRGPAPTIDIAGLDIKDGEIQLQDDARGRALLISQLNARTGRVRIDEPFDASVSAHVQGANPRFDTDIAGKATVRMNPQAQRYEVRGLDLKASGQLPDADARNLTARGNLTYDGQTGAVDASGIEVVFQGDIANVDGGTASVDASLAAERLRADPASGAIQTSKVAVRAKGTLPRGPFEFAADAPALDISPTAASGDAVSARVRIAGPDGVDARLAIDGISGNSSNLAIAQARLAAEIKQGDRGWNVSAASPVTLDLRQRAGAMPSMAGEVVVAAPGLPGGAMRIPYTGALRADLAKKSADMAIDAQVEGGKLTLTADATQLGARPAVRFALNADALDLDKLLPADTQPAAAKPGTAGGGNAAGNTAGGAGTAAPGSGKPDGGKGAQARPGATGAGAEAPGSTAASAANDAASAAAGKPVPNGAGAPSATASGAASPPASAAAQPGAIDLSALIGPTAQGTVKAGRLVVRGVTMQNLSATVKLAQGKLDVSPLAANLYNGKLAGNITLDATRDNAVATRFTLDGVAIGPLLTDLTKRSSLTGVGSVAANLTTHGAQSTAMRDNLAGTLQLRLREGAIKGFDVARSLRDLKQLILGGKGGASDSVPADTSRETTFTRMDADLSLAAGVATIKKLDVASPVIRVSEGSPAIIDLPKGTLDVVANVRLAEPPPVDLRELRGVAVPVHVAGPYDQLRYRVDWRSVAGDAATRALERALGGKGADQQDNESRRDRIRDLGRMLKGITGK